VQKLFQVSEIRQWKKKDVILFLNLLF
jgi:hypothetical protein